MIWLSILSWLKENWLSLTAGILVGICIGYVSSGLTSKQTVLASSSVGAHQSISGTATASSSAVIEIPGRAAQPCPSTGTCPECPAARIVYDCRAALTGGASSSVSSSATVVLNTQVPWGLDFGLGRGVVGSEAWAAQVGLSYGKFRVSTDAAMDGVWRAFVSYRPIGNY